MSSPAKLCQLACCIVGLRLYAGDFINLDGKEITQNITNIQSLSSAEFDLPFDISAHIPLKMTDQCWLIEKIW